MTCKTISKHLVLLLFGLAYGGVAMADAGNLPINYHKDQYGNLRQDLRPPLTGRERRPYDPGYTPMEIKPIPYSNFPRGGSAWDGFKDQHGNLTHRCRDIATGQFTNNYNCPGPKNDNRWR